MPDLTPEQEDLKARIEAGEPVVPPWARHPEWSVKRTRKLKKWRKRLAKRLAEMEAESASGQTCETGAPAAPDGGGFHWLGVAGGPADGHGDGAGAGGGGVGDMAQPVIVVKATSDNTALVVRQGVLPGNVILRLERESIAADGTFQIAAAFNEAAVLSALKAVPESVLFEARTAADKTVRMLRDVETRNRQFQEKVDAQIEEIRRLQAIVDEVAFELPTRWGAGIMCRPKSADFLEFGEVEFRLYSDGKWHWTFGSRGFAPEEILRDYEGHRVIEEGS